MRQTETATDHFIRSQNMLLFRKRLMETIKPAERLLLLRLLQEEKAKGQLIPKDNWALSDYGPCHLGGLTVRG